MFCVTVLRCQLAARRNTLLAGSRHKEAQVTSCNKVLKVTLQKSTFHFVCVRKENPFELTGNCRFGNLSCFRSFDLTGCEFCIWVRRFCSDSQVPKVARLPRASSLRC